MRREHEHVRMTVSAGTASPVATATRPARAAEGPAASAFTLIELLVVIAILTLLMSMLLPGVAKAKKLAQRTVCLAHLHGVGQAAMLYAADNKEFVPWGNRVIWFQAFLPYVSSGPRVTDYRQVGIYRCPSFPDKRQTVCFVGSAWAFNGVTDKTGHSYDSPRSLRDFERPASTLYLTDNEYGPWRQIITSAGSHELSRQDVWTPGHLPTSTSQDITHGRRVARDRHFDGCNGMFLDGHSAWIRAASMTVEMWRDRWRR